MWISVPAIGDPPAMHPWNPWPSGCDAMESGPLFIAAPRAVICGPTAFLVMTAKSCCSLSPCVHWHDRHFHSNTQPDSFRRNHVMPGYRLIDLDTGTNQTQTRAARSHASRGFAPISLFDGIRCFSARKESARCSFTLGCLADTIYSSF